MTRDASPLRLLLMILAVAAVVAVNVAWAAYRCSELFPEAPVWVCVLR